METAWKVYESSFSSRLERLPYYQKDKPCLMKDGPPYWPDGGSSVLGSG